MEEEALKKAVIVLAVAIFIISLVGSFALLNAADDLDTGKRVSERKSSSESVSMDIVGGNNSGSQDTADDGLPYNSPEENR